MADRRRYNRNMRSLSLIIRRRTDALNAFTSHLLYRFFIYSSDLSLRLPVVDCCALYVRVAMMMASGRRASRSTTYLLLRSIM